MFDLNISSSMPCLRLLIRAIFHLRRLAYFLELLFFFCTKRGRLFEEGGGGDLPRGAIISDTARGKFIFSFKIITSCKLNRGVLSVLTLSAFANYLLYMIMIKSKLVSYPIGYSRCKFLT